MNILLIHNYYRIPGGEDTVFNNEAALLREHGENVITYTKDNSDMEPEDFIRHGCFSEKTYRGVRNLIRANDIDIVHVHNERFLITPAVFKAAADENVPVVRTLHNFRMLCINAMLSRNGELCRECIEKGKIKYFPALKHGCFRDDRILTFFNLRINRYAKRHRLYDRVKYIALTGFNKELFVSCGFDPESIYVKPNFSPGFDSNDSDKGTKRSDFIYLGRLDKIKGIEDILSEWQKLPKEFVLNVTGDGEETYVSYLKEHYSRENIVFTGPVSNEEALKSLRTKKAMIFASRLYEGFPMTLIESFSKGTPVIAIDFGNAGSIVKGIYGREEALLNSMTELPDRIKNFDRDRKAGLYDFDKKDLYDYTPEGNYKLLMEIYDSCRESL